MGCRDATRLVEPRAPGSAVSEAGLAATTERRDLSRGWIEHLQPMVVGIGDEEPAVGDGDPERMLQPRVVALAVAIAELEKIPARKRTHIVGGRQRDRANDVGLAVRD